MEKLSLLEKLKTLQQWQMGQHLVFSPSQKQNGIVKNDQHNKENLLPSGGNKISFTETMSKNALSEALKKVHSNESPLEEHAINRSGPRQDNNILKNWHMGGLQTVVNADSDELNQLLSTLHVTSTPFKNKLDNVNTASESSNDEFSDVYPIESQGEEDEPLMDLNNDDDNESITEDVEDCNGERPIPTLQKGAQCVTFEEIVERELRNEQVHNVSHQEGRKHSFLKRRTGLQRFTKGRNYVKKVTKKKKPESSVKTMGLPMTLKLRHPNTIENNVAKESEVPLVSVNISENVRQDAYIPDTQSLNNSPSQSVRTSLLETSFQNMLAPYKEKEKIAEHELKAFEALEEAAENVSLSSNCSLVRKLLGKSTEEKTSIDPPSSDSCVNVYEEAPPHVKSLFDFSDENSWSDESHMLSDKTMDSTLICEGSPSSEVMSPNVPPKRIISKRKTDVTRAIDNQFQDSEINGEEEKISATVKLKLEELKNEIRKFREENSKLTKLREERESDLAQLRKEIDQFEKEKNEEVARIQEYKGEEMKKIKVERKIFDQYQKSCKEQPNKKERAEIKSLKDEVEQLRGELKNKETRWNAATHRFRSKIAQLEERNNELQEEVRVFEQERIKRWKNAQNHRSTQVEDMRVYCSGDDSSTNESSLFVPTSTLLDRKTSQKETRLSFPLKQTIEDFTMNEVRHSDGKVERREADGRKVVIFPNGTEKTISADEQTTSIRFFNGDVKETFPDQRMVYYYAQSQTTHTTYPDGMETIQFPNNQVERRFPDGRVEIAFCDGTMKKIDKCGGEETLFADGTVQRLDMHGVKTILFPNGEKEIHTEQYKKREYPNGTVKTVFADGRQETKYSNGRIRVKDKHGFLLIDTSDS